MPAFTKECKLCSHMNHFNSQKCQQCHAQLAIGGKPTAKVGLRKVRSVKCVEIELYRTCKQCSYFPLSVALGKKEKKTQPQVTAYQLPVTQ